MLTENSSPRLRCPWLSFVTACWFIGLGASAAQFANDSPGSQASAEAGISWNVQKLVADADISNQGLLVEAAHFSGPGSSIAYPGKEQIRGTITVNAVPFQAVDYSRGDSLASLTGLTYDGGEYGHTRETTGHQALAAGLALRSGQVEQTANLVGLEVGSTYAIQLVYYHATVNRALTVAAATHCDGGGVLSESGTPLIATGTFVADAASKTLTLTSSIGSQFLNAYQLRRLHAPDHFEASSEGVDPNDTGNDSPEPALFDGKTLSGWNVRPGEESHWRVEDGVIIGGDLSSYQAKNTFLCTNASFQNFDLRLKIRLRAEKKGYSGNSGIQIRSTRVPKNYRHPHEMRGYQVDAGDRWWGKLYDESRRNRVIAQAADLNAINQAVRDAQWNDYRIRADGPRIQTWINGVPAVDYTERDPKIPLDGQIGIQLHGGAKAMVEIKDVVLVPLPPSKDVMTWERLENPTKAPSQPKQKTEPATPEKQRAGFTVPEGFEVELVAAETEGIGKFVAVAFDTKGRMWTMTALEYPADTMLNRRAANRLFEEGGRDKILVFDHPFEKDVAPPRVFAEGLALPLGILPYKDGVFAQYGSDIRFYHDRDGDGTAEGHETVLTGFGIEDSHLFPHQFTRVPGNWILTAQGAFNRSRVKRPGGKLFADQRESVIYNHCKVVRFTPDGSLFEKVSAGPSNMWGLARSREGETWVQEANDNGYPIAPFDPGAYYLMSKGAKRLRDYQPMMPKVLFPPQMGGSGLSGLALADDRDGWPAPWGIKNAAPMAPRRFYVANPITQTIQCIEAVPQENGRYAYKKLPDFITSDDPFFRPVAIQFGPDSCLYVVDWYNEIIAHDKGNHPKRDKTRGRIWRIRHVSQGAPKTPPVLAVLSSREVMAHLGDDNARIADLAWQALIDRQAVDRIPELLKVAGDAGARGDRRLAALWALEGLTTVPGNLLVALAQDSNARLRAEAVRVAGAQDRPNSEFLAVASPLVDDPAPRVRGMLGDALRRVKVSDPALIQLMMRLGKGPLAEASEWDVYDRESERYLARWAMENNRAAVAGFLASEDADSLPVENRVLAIQALEGKDVAIHLARLLPSLKRSPSDDEMRTLLSFSDDPEVNSAIRTAFENPELRKTALKTLYGLRSAIDLSKMALTIENAVLAIWRDQATLDDRKFAIDMAGGFELQKMEPFLIAFLAEPKADRAVKIATLQALQLIGLSQADGILKLMDSEADSELRQLLLDTLAGSKDASIQNTLAARLSSLTYGNRLRLISKMAASREGATAILEAVIADKLAVEEIPSDAFTMMNQLLSDDPRFHTLLAEGGVTIPQVLALGGGASDYLATAVDLTGPFTVEGWIQLAPGIGSEDGLLGRRDVMSMNFAAEQLRVFLPSVGDVVVAKDKAVPHVWTHYAVTRDTAGTIRLYTNGERDGESKSPHTGDLKGLNVGRSYGSKRGQGMHGTLSEVRIWNTARSQSELRDNFDRSFLGAAQPSGLIHYFSGSAWGELQGNAKIIFADNHPPLLTAEDAELQAQRFAKFRALAKAPGKAQAGKPLFEAICLACHQQGGKGASIGPPLDGIGFKAVDLLLRDILTPSAVIEGGYRGYQVITRAGQILRGVHVSSDAKAIIIMQQGGAERRIPREEIERAGYLNASAMPAALLDGLAPQQASDLLLYIQNLRN